MNKLLMKYKWMNKVPKDSDVKFIKIIDKENRFKYKILILSF